MKTLQSYLLCDSPEHAEIVDQLVFAYLQETYKTCGSSWSGVFTDGTRYGILWASPVSELFGDLAESGEVVESVIDAEGNSNWHLFVPVVEPEEISL